MTKILNRILGERLTLRLGFRKPAHISDNNLIVYSYLESVEGAYHEGTLELSGDSKGSELRVTATPQPHGSSEE